MGVLALGRVAERGDKSSLSALSACLDDEENVIVASLESLGYVAENGDEHMVGILLPHLKHKNHLIRIAASQSLSRVARKGDEQVNAAVDSLLDDPNVHVRQVA